MANGSSVIAFRSNFWCFFLRNEFGTCWAHIKLKGTERTAGIAKKRAWSRRKEATRVTWKRRRRRNSREISCRGMKKERRGYHHQLARTRTRIFHFFSTKEKKQQRNTYSIASEPKRRHGDSKVTHCCRSLLGPHCWPSNYQRRTIRRL